MALMPPVPPDDQYWITLKELKTILDQAAERGWDLKFYLHNEKGELTHTLESAETTPKGVNIAPKQRIGDQGRDKYFEHLHKMFAGGYISQAEHDARVDALMLANTKDEMEFLVKDLPKMNAVEKSEKPLPAVQDKGRITIDPPAFTVLTFISVVMTVVLGSLPSQVAHSLSGMFFVALVILVVGKFTKKL